MILLIDSYDSFTNNLKHLIEANSGKHVVTIFNDTFLESEYETVFNTWIRHFDSIIIGPGPGHPANEKDTGIIRYIYQRCAEDHGDCVPILGVCLGFQSLCQEFGNPVTRLESVKHGQIYEIVPKAGGLFSTATPFDSVRYHSLHVDMNTLNDTIVPLATCQENDTTTLLMAAKHAFLPLYGVQYHPESICSEKGDELIRNFDALTEEYNRTKRPGLADKQKSQAMQDYNQKMIDQRAIHETSLWPEVSGQNPEAEIPTLFMEELRLQQDVRPIDVCDFLHQQNVDFFFLNSAADPGEWSVIGLPIVGENEVITHSTDDEKHVYLSTYKGDSCEKIQLGNTVWEFVASKFQRRSVPRARLEEQSSLARNQKLPFFGGYMGMFSYEEGKHVNLEHMKSFCSGATPDTKLVHIERFILCHRKTHKWVVGSIRANDEDFCSQMQENIAKVTPIDLSGVPSSVKHLCKTEDQQIDYSFPDRDVYHEQMKKCQEALNAGDSYELCLTTQSKVFLPSYLDTWEIYKILALKKNPSPYSSYMNFDDCILVSSSPERFLSWKDSDTPNSKIAELRPIKGTVKNTDTMTLDDATRLLRTPKEMGENLMIVDLIRHDLQSFTENVKTEALMTVEEYKTVYQLVSVIQGHLGTKGYKGIDVLHSSLPPGSMTGAPKKRSMELLQSIEGLQKNTDCGRRGFYSGVAGYWTVTDDADWSVTIRSLVHYKNDIENTQNTNAWRIGAGGAITVLSDETGEWEEMQLKLTSTLQTFL